MVGEVGRQSPSPRQPCTLAAMSRVIPVERLWELYDCNPLAGTLISKRTGKTRTGVFHHRRYNLMIRFNKKQHCVSYGAAVYAWCVGYWPKPTIDHKDRNPLNNAIHNLAPATHREQNQNRACFNGGATYRKDRKTWFARIKANGESKHLGTFSTKEEAQAAYAAALSELVS